MKMFVRDDALVNVKWACTYGYMENDGYKWRNKNNMLNSSVSDLGMLLSSKERSFETHGTIRSSQIRHREARFALRHDGVGTGQTTFCIAHAAQLSQRSLATFESRDFGSDG